MITIDNISYTYPREYRPALEGIHAVVPDGIYLLAGENGAGKTTLLHLISGLRTPSSGKIFVNGNEANPINPSERGETFLFEDNIFFPGSTIRKFAAMHSRFYPRFSSEAFESNLRAFGLTGNEAEKGMSMGTLKKARLAYVLALGVKTLLLDEPSNSLDIEGRAILRRLLVGNSRQDQTIVIATHHVAELDPVFDGAMILRGSRMAFCRSDEDVNERLAFTVSRIPDPDALYSETQVGRVLNIVKADADYPDTTRPDWRLLYSALHSDRASELTHILNTRQ